MDNEDEFDFLINFIKNAEDLSSHIEASQLRCLWTAFCLHHDISVGSLVYDVMYRSLVEAVKRNISANYEDEEYRILHDRMSMYVRK